MGRTTKIVEDRREQIMEAALRVFAKKGYTRTSNKDIAREAGITPGLIYHYFESKDALLKAIFADRSPLRLVRSFPEQLLELPPEAFLRFLVQQMLSVVEDEKFMQLLRIYLPEVIYNPEAAPQGIAAIAEAVHFVEGYLTARMESGELCTADPGLVTHLLMGSVMDIALRRQVLHDPLTLQYTPEQIVESLVSLTLRGLLAR
jgi:AcrR family transcriptional regulator